MYGNFLCPDLAHAAGDELIARCMRESVETLSNTSKSSTYALALRIRTFGVAMLGKMAKPLFQAESDFF